MNINTDEKTFFGFWPADDNHCSLDALTLNANSHSDEATQGKLKDILLLSLTISLFATSFHPECIVIYGVFWMVVTTYHFYYFYSSLYHLFITR